MQHLHHFFIDGAWVPPHRLNAIEVVDPSTEQPIASLALGAEEDVERAVTAAARAFLSWSETPLKERKAAVVRLAEVYQRRAEEMGAAISREMGAPIDLATTAQVGSGSGHFQTFLDLIGGFEFEEWLEADSHCHRILKEPIGVVALITPWNWPMNQIALKVVPALLTGCTVVLKPSEIAPLSGHLFAEMVAEAGIPAGVFNLVHGNGAGVGSALTAHPRVDMVSFTGSNRAGVAISKTAADTIKRVSLELGGKGANILFDDADEEAVARGLASCFLNSGQGCNAPSRMLVHRGIYEETVAKAAEIARAVQVAPASRPGDHIGPVVSRAQYERIQGLIASGLEQGARLVAGGLGRPEGLEIGYFVRPTVLADCTNDMTVAREEIFGPVQVIIPFDSEEEAIAIANDTVFGLTNYVQSADLDRARRVARALRSGMVEINGVGRSWRTPFGGYKQSGSGREGGLWGIEEFLEVKAVSGWDGTG
ncbi:aldehyde dehydrogenase family protein [Stappia indica]|uniref:aldehyde dehydrogenase family protein n=1 Tax=Stappia indica TaxID=538381 RepID=UPI001CD226F0|nr:aldehyde dehydrogenase family protein [Stappia indica]MCA1298442.1 aldehyde dehydrogenase family protein [Stappia indica]